MRMPVLHPLRSGCCVNTVSTWCWQHSGRGRRRRSRCTGVPAAACSIAGPQIWISRCGGRGETYMAELRSLHSAGGISAHEFDECLQFVNDASSASGRRAVIEDLPLAHRILQEHAAIPAGLRSVPAGTIDAEARYLGAPNGIVDLDTGQLLSGTGARRALVSNTIPGRVRTGRQQPPRGPADIPHARGGPRAPAGRARLRTGSRLRRQDLRHPWRPVQGRAAQLRAPCPGPPVLGRGPARDAARRP